MSSISLQNVSLSLSLRLNARLIEISASTPSHLYDILPPLSQGAERRVKDAHTQRRERASVRGIDSLARSALIRAPRAAHVCTNAITRVHER